MGKWLHKALKPGDEAESDPHADMEDLACLIEGKLGGDERENLLRHLNQCGRCYQILQDTMNDLQAEPSGESAHIPWWKTRPVHALAASIVLLVLIGGPLVYQFQTRQSWVTSVDLILDQELKDILLEDDALQWTNDKRIHRLYPYCTKKAIA